MQTKGKFYIWLNIASAHRYYWSVPAQNFTSVPQNATFFNSKAEADAEAIHATFNHRGEAIVDQATRDIPDMVQS